MKILHKTPLDKEKIELQMTPMIDIVFQLLVFFILTFRVVAQEADFNIRMPAVPPEPDMKSTPQVLKVRIEADASGIMSDLKLNNKSLGSGAVAFTALRSEICSKMGVSAGPLAPSEVMAVEFDCDYELNYDCVIRAIDAISGYKVGSDDSARIKSLIKTATVT